MNLAPDKAQGIADAYSGDDTVTVATVAELYEVKESTVRDVLGERGIAIRTENGDSDADLGIGEPDKWSESDAFQQAVREAVAAEIAKLGVAPPSNAAPSPGGDWDGFMQRLEKLTSSLDVQKPGYQKPLTPDEIGSRREGHDEFFALLAHVRHDVAEHGKPKAARMGLVPEYIVGEGGFYGNTVNGETLFMPGQRMFLTAAPPEDFLPCNEIAGRIMRAQLQWLGEPTPPVEELVAAAMMRANGSDPSFVMANEQPAHADEAELIQDSGIVDVGPRRTMGTTVHEQRAKPGPRAPGQTTAPQGPIFVGD